MFRRLGFSKIISVSFFVGLFLHGQSLFGGVQVGLKVMGFDGIRGVLGGSVSYAFKESKRELSLNLGTGLFSSSVFVLQSHLITESRFIGHCENRAGYGAGVVYNTGVDYAAYAMEYTFRCGKRFYWEASMSGAYSKAFSSDYILGGFLAGLGYEWL